MKNVAFITYNSLDGLSSGWHEANGRRALVLQNTKGEGSRVNGRPIGSANREEQIGMLWTELQNNIHELDHVVVYVGANGSQRAIELASQLPPTKVTFVSCDCGLDIKELLITLSGLSEAGRVLCECGGHLTMKVMFQTFMRSGELRRAA